MGGRTAEPGAPLELRLPYRRPMDLDRTLRYLAARAIAGVEHFDGTTLRRTLRLPDRTRPGRTEQRRVLQSRAVRPLPR